LPSEPLILHFSLCSGSLQSQNTWLRLRAIFNLLKRSLRSASATREARLCSFSASLAALSAASASAAAFAELSTDCSLLFQTPSLDNSHRFSLSLRLSGCFVCCSFRCLLRSFCGKCLFPLLPQKLMPRRSHHVLQSPILCESLLRFRLQQVTRFRRLSYISASQAKISPRKATLARTTMMFMLALRQSSKTLIVLRASSKMMHLQRIQPHRQSSQTLI
jgi:hypothetical protein